MRSHPTEIWGTPRRPTSVERLEAVAPPPGCNSSCKTGGTNHPIQSSINHPSIHPARPRTQPRSCAPRAGEKRKASARRWNPDGSFNMRSHPTKIWGTPRPPRPSNALRPLRLRPDATRPATRVAPIIPSQPWRLRKDGMQRLLRNGWHRSSIHPPSRSSIHPAPLIRSSRRRSLQKQEHTKPITSSRRSRR